MHFRVQIQKIVKLIHLAKAHYNVEQNPCPHGHEQSFQSMSLTTTLARTPFYFSFNAGE